MRKLLKSLLIISIFISNFCFGAEKPIFSGRVRSLPKASKEFTELAQDSGVPQEQLIVLHIFLGLLGSPNYTMLGEDKGMTSFIFDNGEDSFPPFLLAINLKEKSIIPKGLKWLGWRTQKKGQWTYITKRENYYHYLDNEKAFTKFLESKPRHDFEADFNPRKLLNHPYARRKIASHIPFDCQLALSEFTHVNLYADFGPVKVSVIVQPHGQTRKKTKEFGECLKKWSEKQIPDLKWRFSGDQWRGEITRRDFVKAVSNWVLNQYDNRTKHAALGDES